MFYECTVLVLALLLGAIYSLMQDLYTLQAPLKEVWSGNNFHTVHSEVKAHSKNLFFHKETSCKAI